jgi:hypothetical protein
MRRKLILVILIVVTVLASSVAASMLGAQSSATGKESFDLRQRGPYQMVADSREGVWVLDVKAGRVKYCTMNDFGSVSCSAWSNF